MEPIKHNLIPRRKKVGKERRIGNIARMLSNNISFPEPVGYKDCDNAFREWVDNSLSITFDGNILPTFNLFSNQRISEYTQNWNHLDDNGNYLMNFKSITRENNPKAGTIYGGKSNIPGKRQYLMGYKEVMQENGLPAYDAYSMEQPYAVDIKYKVSLITNKYELLNEFNQLVLREFSAKQAYIYPNKHAMSMILEDVSDESEYNINDRKFYSQSYTITLRAYIIDKEGFKVTHLPNRINGFTRIDSHAKRIKKEVINTLVNEGDETKIIIDCSNFDNSVTTNYKGSKPLSVINIELDGILEMEKIYINREKLEDIEETGITIETGDEIKIDYKKDFSSKQNTITLTCQ